MRLLTFLGSSGPEAGALDPAGQIVPLSRSGLPALASIQALIEAGPEGLAQAQAVLARRTEDRAWRRAMARAIAAPSADPRFPGVRRAHAHGRMARAQLRATWGAPPAPPEPMPIPPIWYEQPIYYKGNRFAVAGPDSTVRWPAYSRVIDYELEIACVIGSGGRDIAAADAHKHIFGYTIFNDLTARDAQFREMQGPLGPAKGKDFDGANILGPVIVTADELPDLAPLAMRASVNGTVWSEGKVGTMHWTFADIIAHVSASETLHPGKSWAQARWAAAAAWSLAAS
jgi:2-keto-4-pentenoate hydratase/2-oxohepta-3-ene-1,7-dioic acid hydratase in catechol pathway